MASDSKTAVANVQNSLSPSDMECDSRTKPSLNAVLVREQCRVINTGRVTVHQKSNSRRVSIVTIDTCVNEIAPSRILGESPNRANHQRA